MPRIAKEEGTLPQNTGHPKRDQTSDPWRNSILVGPQTAGIPTIQNEDEWYTDADNLVADRWMEVPSGRTDMTGGAVDYNRKQRRR